jgi:hypothetical protein
MALANLTPAPLPLPSPELLFDPGGKAASVELLSRRSLLAQGVELGIFCFQEGDKGYYIQAYEQDLFISQNGACELRSPTTVHHLLGLDELGHRDGLADRPLHFPKIHRADGVGAERPIDVRAAHRPDAAHALKSRPDHDPHAVVKDKNLWESSKGKAICIYHGQGVGDLHLSRTLS